MFTLGFIQVKYFELVE